VENGGRGVLQGGFPTGACHSSLTHFAICHLPFMRRPGLRHHSYKCLSQLLRLLLLFLLPWPLDFPLLVFLLFMLLIRLVSCLLIALPTRVVSLSWPLSIFTSSWVPLQIFWGVEKGWLRPLCSTRPVALIL